MSRVSIKNWYHSNVLTLNLIEFSDISFEINGGFPWKMKLEPSDNEIIGW